ncbi:Hemolysin-type calcium-binding region [Chlorobium limicola DSM 245]|uniref:Hemolysin-type calcium-binding region n=1 Tax=Chlorobium limicola (strain DSM 245 / NBRC 103803 / 6330) TaxID=290315 RepID=B3EGS1_CHLL2|nr:DUF4347 domain-containing protein [Chlorobium limicola]ACD91184.1 Hemolysin-type calcium-binding region [Chlorobium limicola DSM 245]
MNNSIIFIDGRVKDSGILIENFAAGQQYVILDPSRDGLEQMLEALQGRSGLDSIQIISHGSAGTLIIGSTILTSKNVSRYDGQLRLLGQSLHENGDILLYGCNVGEGREGKGFLALLAGYTGADMAASDDLTGSRLKGGDWTLEVTAGSVESAMKTPSSDVYGHTLATIIGTVGNDLLNGTSASDLLLGLEGNDTLDGKAGADSMEGGAGDDTYVVDHAGDSIVEHAGEGIDIVRSSVSYVLGENLEHLVLTGSKAINGIGNALDNLITGNTGINILDGGAGNDSIDGGSGNDIISGETGDDQLAGGTGNDRIYGGEGDDRLDGGAGKDNLEGGSGSDQLFGNDSDDQLSGSEGNDALDGGTGNDSLDGGDGDDMLLGGIGNDLLDGGIGNDMMQGGRGNDTYSVDSENDIIVENAGEGTDSVQASINYVLSGNLEKLTLTGTDAIDGTGNELNNTITGNSGANILDGGAGNDTLDGGAGDDMLLGGIGNELLDGGIGNDTMQGGIGNDTYSVDSENDVIVENAGEGTDSVQASINYVLSGNIEKLILTGSDDIHGTGNELNNALTGNSGANMLDGGSGNDTLEGGAGADVLLGGIGNDLLDGGIGNDTMQGGEGNDTYVVDNEGDEITENAGEGTDSVQSSVSYALSSSLERLTLTGSGSVNGYGNDLDNAVTGNAGNNELSGSGGNDTISGGAGNDLIWGGTGNDKLDGGIGADTMTGGSGNDTYVVDNESDGITENEDEGVDNVQASVSYALSQNIEQLILTGSGSIDGTGNSSDNDITGNRAGNALYGAAGNDTIDGGAGDDTIDGGAGNDLLEGNTGNDTLEGGEGSDTLTGGSGSNMLSGGDGDDMYILESGDDTIIEDAEGGNDTVRTASSHILEDGVENLVLVGTGAIDGTGNALNNVITGGRGYNRLDGSAGTDTLEGGSGNDTYVVDSSGDVVVEQRNSGTDTVESSSDHALSENVENLILTGTSDINGFGNSLNNVIAGNDGNNLIEGGSGNDLVDGGIGADTLTGGAGNDSITGGAGDDTAIYSGNFGDYLITYDAGTSAYTIEDTIDGRDGTDVISHAEYFVFADGLKTKDELIGNNLNGTENDDTLTGTEHDDMMDGFGGNDSISGMGGNDTLYGGSGNDTLYGDDGEDALYGAEGDDVMDGGAGNDFLHGDSGNDSMFGGSGNDQLHGSDGADALHGNADDDMLFGIAGDDALYGDEGSDSLHGGEGNDLVDGGTGNDLLHGNQGADTMYGGEGNDSVEGGDDSDLQYGDGGDDYMEGDGGDDTIHAGEGADIVYGGDGNDSIHGNQGADTLHGGEGSDSVEGGDDSDLQYGDGGDDYMEGDGGDDALFGGDGNDGIIGGDDNDSVDGGAGDDMIEGSDGNDTVVGGDGDDVIYGDELHDSPGGDDLLYGGDGNDILVGGFGNDSLNGGVGNDSLFGGNEYNLGADDGIDTLAGGVGDDIYFVDSLQDIVKENSGEGQDTVLSFIDYTLLDEVENLELLDGIRGTGNALDNVVTGNGRDNVLDGQSGNDTIEGGSGNDSVWGGSGSDSIDGGAGNDYLSGTDYYGYADGGDADMITGGAGDDDIRGGAGNDVLSGDDGRDSLYGENGADDIDGGDGDDSLYGGDGNDAMAGEEGSDWIYGESGEDSLYGGNGNDALDGGDGDDSVSGGEGDDYLHGGHGYSEWVYNAVTGGSDLVYHADGQNTLYGGSGSDTLYGSDGNDVLAGDADADTLDGSTGSDSMLGGEGDDYLYGGGTTYVSTYDSATDIWDTMIIYDGNDTLDGGTGNDYLSAGDGNDLLQGGEGDDQLYGGQGSNMLDGGDGADYLRGEGISDTLLGGDGDDDLSGSYAYYDSVSGFHYDGGSSLDGGIGNDSLYAGNGNDSLYGGDGDDYLEAGYGYYDSYSGTWITGNVTLDGGYGNDTISGRDGNDLLVGGAGDDDLSDWAGANTLEGGDGNDTLTGGYGNDLIDGGTGNDSISGGDGFDMLDGGTGDDTMIAGYDYGSGAASARMATSGGSTLDGGAGNDSIFGGAGDDSLVGGTGNDYLYDWNGANTIDGGEGDDTISYSSGDAFIDGGDGVDTLVLDSSASVSFSEFVSSDVRNVEVIDLSVHDDHALFDIRVADVAVMTGGNPLYIRGDEGDFISFDNGETDVWSKDGETVSIDGITYEYYTNDADPAVQVYVQTGITIEMDGSDPLMVTTLADDGSGSLRRALEYVNANGGESASTITFAISGTILVNPENPLPAITHPVSFVMDGNKIEVKQESGSEYTPVLLIENDVEVVIPEACVITVAGTGGQFAVGGYGTVVLNGMAGTVNAFVSAGGEETGMDRAMGVAAAVNLVIDGNLSGDVTAVAPDEAMAVEGEENLTIYGDVSGRIVAESEYYAQGLKASHGDVTITGDVSGEVSASATDAAGDATGVRAKRGNITIGSISGSISALGTDTAGAIYAGDIDFEGGDDEEEGEAISPMMVVGSGDITINGNVSGGITATSSSGLAFGILAENNLSIGSLSDTAFFDVDGKYVAAGFGAYHGSVTVNGDVDGSIDAEATEGMALAISAMTGIVIGGDLAAEITVHAHGGGGADHDEREDSDCNAYGIQAGGGDIPGDITIGSMSGTMEVTSDFGGAYGIVSDAGFITIGSVADSASITVTGFLKAIGVSAPVDLVINGEMAGEISATSAGHDEGNPDAEFNAYGIYAYHDLTIGAMTGAVMASAQQGEAVGLKAEKGNLVINGDVSGSVTVHTGKGTAFGIEADDDMQITGTVSGHVSSTTDEGEACGVIAQNHLSIQGDVSDTAVIEARGSDFAVGMGGSEGGLDITGDMAGFVTAVSTLHDAYGLGSGVGDVNLGSYSGSVAVDARTIAVGIGAGADYIEFADQEPPVSPEGFGDLTIGGDFSGDVTVTSANGFAFGVIAAENLTIQGNVTDSAAITVTVTNTESPDDGVAIGAINNLVIVGDMAGAVTATAYEAGGIAGMGSMTLGALSGSITVNGGELADGMKGQSIEIVGDLSGNITVNASDNEAYGIDAQSGDVTIGGDLSGTVSVSAEGVAYGLRGGNHIALGSLSGEVSASSVSNNAVGLRSNGSITGGGDGDALEISGTVRAEGFATAAAISAGGAMNLEISGTVSGTTTEQNGNAIAILSWHYEGGTSFSFPDVSDQVTVTDTGKLVGKVILGGGDDIMTLQNGSDLSGVPLLDGGTGTDRLVFTGYTSLDASVGSAIFRNFEVIDMTDGHSTLISNVGYSNVIAVTDADHDLFILGDDGDEVEFSDDGSGFWFSETVSIDGVEYAHYIMDEEDPDVYVQSGLVVGYSNDLVQHGTSSDDSIIGTPGNDALYGHGGNDTLDGQGGDDVLDGGTGNDTLYGGEGNDTLYGGEEADDSTGGGYRTDSLYGGAGNDVLEVSDVDGYLDGGEGDDDLSGDSGNDTMYGGAGNDTIDGSDGNNYLDGGEDNDVLVGDDDRDTLIGGEGNDTLLSDKGDDSLSGGDGDDYLHGEWGSSELDYVGTGEMIVPGGPEDGSDTLDGGAGNDTLIGGAGDDTLIGGDGNDTAVFSGNYEDYTITYDVATFAYTVVDSIADRDGTDVVGSVETFLFADGTRSSNAAPALTAFSGAIATTDEDTESVITLDDLKAQGDESDADGTVDAFVIKSVTTGILKIGADAASATAYDATTNNTVDATHHAYWTPESNANGTLEAFEAVAKDNEGAESVPAVPVSVSVNAVYDPAVANDDYYTVEEDGVLRVIGPGILSNDTGDDIVLHYYTWNKHPDHGTVTQMSGDGSFTYVPDADFSGTDTFEYLIDGYLNGVWVGHDFATVTIEVTPESDVPGLRAFNESLNGLDGNDTLVFSWGDVIDGGDGIDALVFNSGDDLDFSAYSSGSGSLMNIEVLDLAINGDHAITNITVDAVSSMTSGNELYILGDSGDTVQLADGWSNQGSLNVNGMSYTHYSSTDDGSVNVYVQGGISDHTLPSGLV